MSVRSGQSITAEFTTRVWGSGVGTNADSLPVGTLVLNGVDNAAVVTVTNIDTGRYKFAVTLPTLAVSDVVEMSIAATVSSVADKAIVWRDTKDFFAGSIPDVIAGGAGGLLIAGSNAATTFVTLTSTGAFTVNGVSDVAQTGDSFARLGAAGAGLTAVVLAAAGLNAVLVDGKTLPAALQIIGATAAGKISGAGTGTETFLGLDGATTRVTVSADSSGNRTAIVYA